MVYINGRFLTQQITGVNRFALEICKQLKKQGLDFTIILPAWFEYSNDENFNIIQRGHLKSHFWEQVDLLRFLKKNGNPLLINFSGLGPLWYNNQIVTIHDLSFFVNSKWFSRTYAMFYSFATPIIAKNAVKIITVSEFSKGEIMKYLRLKANKIKVIANAVSSSLESTPGNSYEPLMEEKYILAVSSIDPRKNLQRLVDIFVSQDSEFYKLVLVGKTAKHFNIKLSHRSERIIYKGFVSDKELLSLYNHCEVFIYPSLYEGFGIPPLEAMKNGCAVIVSDIPSLREVCGDAALYFDPYSDYEINERILRVTQDTRIRKELQAKGKIRAAMFSWEKSGSEVYDLINDIILN